MYTPTRAVAPVSFALALAAVAVSTTAEREVLAAVARAARDGVSKTADPPTEWSETKNMRWKIEIPGRGFVTPVVWGDRCSC